MSDTIFAQATPPGRSGVAILRLSGPSAVAAVRGLGATGVRPRRAALRRLVDPRDGAPIDQALVIWFEGPSSFTGEDVMELHLHGGHAVVQAASSALGAMEGLREAEPGEFTRRALLNGKLDLAQVEGLGDLLAAETAAQAQQAMLLMEGRLSQVASRWRDEIVSVLSLVEACIDFSDDGVSHEVLHHAPARLRALEESIERELRGSAASERLREGYEVALVGPPNVGKSTLLNALAGREAALTSEVAGTTRDVIEVRMDLGGLPVTLLDMAGIRDSDDQVEKLGVERALRRGAAADVRVFLLVARGDVQDLGLEPAEGDIVVLGKADTLEEDVDDAVSGLTGAGVDRLLKNLQAELECRSAGAGFMSHDRQRRMATAAREGVSAAAARLVDVEPHLELVAAELGGSLRSLDALVGRTDVEAVLDAVFRQFCLGK